MADAGLLHVVRRLRRAAGPGATMTDRQLLDRFQRQRDDPAFEELLRRHGNAVWAVCRQVLPHAPDAEDAFQATFLVLLQKAGVVRWRPALRGWLCAVAHRVAVRTRGRAARRRERPIVAEPGHEPNLPRAEAHAILHEELDRLPDQFRLPLLLCHLDGRSRDEVAALLGWSAGSVKGRLERGKAVLRERLAKRGVGPVVGLVAAAALAPPDLFAATTRLAVALLAANGAIPPNLSPLMDGVTPTLTRSSGKFVLAAVLAVVLLGGGALAYFVATTNWEFAGPDEAALFAADADPDVPTGAATPPAPVGGTFTYAGRVLAPDGKPVAGAKVRLAVPSMPLTQVRATSDAQGRFRFTGRQDELPPPRLSPEGLPAHLIATADGYGFAVAGVGPPAGPLASAEGLTLWLVEDAPVRGRVVDLQGKPVAGVTVKFNFAWSAADETGRPRPLHLPDHPQRQGGSEVQVRGLIPDAVTDADGRVEVRGLGTGRMLTVTFIGEQIHHHAGRIWTVPMTEWQPHVKAAQDIRVTAGLAVYGPEFTHVANPARPIVGTVRDRDTGKPIPGVIVSVPNTAGDTTDANGRYRLVGLRPRAYGLSVWPRDLPYLPADAPVNDPGPGLQPVVRDIELRRAPVVHGRVIDRATGRPAAGSVIYRPLAINPNAGLMPEYVQDGSRVLQAVFAWLDADGRFTLPVLPGPGVLLTKVGDDVRPAQLRLAHRIPGATHPEMASLLNTAPLPTDVSQFHAYRLILIPAGTEEMTADLPVDSGRAIPIQAVGPDGRPVTARAVGLWPPAVDDLGKHTRRTLWGGAGTVFALAPGEQRRVYAKSLDDTLAGFTTLDGREPAVTLALQPTGRVVFRLLDPAGRPLTRARVQLAYDDGPDAGRLVLEGGSAERLATDAEHRQKELVRGHYIHPKRGFPTDVRTADADGRFRLTGVIAGLTFTVRVGAGAPGEHDRKPGSVAEVAGVRVAPGGAVDLGDVRFGAQ